MTSAIQRKLTTILAADAQGYSRAMADNESRTIADLRSARAVFSRFIERHGGRIANTAGDGLIAEFPSVVEAVQCAVEVQNELQDRDGAALRFRIGIHLGDVIVDGADLLGDGVNIAARLQSLAEPGGVLISRQVYDQVHSKLTVGFQHLGERQVRNLPEDVDVYRIAFGAQTAPDPDFDNAVFLSRPAPRKAAVMPAAEPPKPAPAPEPDPRPQEPATSAAPAAPLGKNPMLRNGLIIAGIAVFVDLASGPGFWAHWVILPALTAYGFYAAPRLATGRLSAETLRIAILAAALIVINLVTWSGSFWAIWPVGAAVAFAILRGRKTDRDA